MLPVRVAHRRQTAAHRCRPFLASLPCPQREEPAVSRNTPRSPFRCALPRRFTPHSNHSDGDGDGDDDVYITEAETSFRCRSLGSHTRIPRNPPPPAARKRRFLSYPHRAAKPPGNRVPTTPTGTHSLRTPAPQLSRPRVGVDFMRPWPPLPVGNPPVVARSVPLR